MKFFHSGSRGDIIYSLPSIIYMGGGDLYLSKLDQYDDLKTLLETQRYLYNVKLYSGEKMDIDLSRYRKNPNIDKQHLAITHLQCVNGTYDLSKPWMLGIEPKSIAPIVVHRTTRYHDMYNIDYSILQKFKDQVIFIGNDVDYIAFERKYGNIPRYKCSDLLEMAKVISGCKIFIGNQSVGFAISEAIKKKRFLEVCMEKNNCLPNSNNGYTVFNEDILRSKLKESHDLPSDIPKDDIDKSPILSCILEPPCDNVIFLPNHGEFGATIDKVIKVVSYKQSLHKIVCCKEGEESLYPDANEFYYDWEDFVEDEYKWGLFAQPRRKNPRRHIHKDMLNTEFEKIKKRFGDNFKYVHMWPFSRDDVFSKYSHLFRVELKSKLDKKVNVVISPRFRKSRPENNFLGWDYVCKKIKEKGYSIGCVGSESGSIKIEESSMNSWDYTDNSSACVSMLNNCDLYLGLDTGVSHLASMLSCPMIVFSHANQRHYLTSFMKNLTTNYFKDLGKNVVNIDYIISEVVSFLEKKYGKTE